MTREPIDAVEFKQLVDRAMVWDGEEPRGITAETYSRRYLVVGLRTDDMGDPVIEIEFDDLRDAGHPGGEATGASQKGSQ